MKIIQCVTPSPTPFEPCSISNFYPLISMYFYKNPLLTHISASSQSQTTISSHPPRTHASKILPHAPRQNPPRTPLHALHETRHRCAGPDLWRKAIQRTIWTTNQSGFRSFPRRRNIQYEVSTKKASYSFSERDEF